MLRCSGSQIQAVQRVRGSLMLNGEVCLLNEDGIPHWILPACTQLPLKPTTSTSQAIGVGCSYLSEVRRWRHKILMLAFTIVVVRANGKVVAINRRRGG
jgi:hypothetical protein